jgi:predicted Zn-dependent peptidase
MYLTQHGARTPGTRMARWALSPLVLCVAALGCAEPGGTGTERAPVAEAPRPAAGDPAVPGDPIVLTGGPSEDALPEGVTLVEDAVAGDALGVTVYRLANGLTVMLSVNREEPRVQCWTTVRAGSNKDPADATGMAHYLEHMHFKGTTRLGTVDWEQERVHLDAITELYDELFVTTDPERRAEVYAKIDVENQAASRYAVASELDRAYDAMGASGLNAFTTAEQTSYTVEVPKNRLETWAKLEAERFRDPVYRMFQTEIEAVYEEKNRSLDNKDWAVYPVLMEALFPEHPFGTQPTIGTVEHLKNPSVSKMYEYFRTWYVPANMVVALAGDFDKAEAIETLARHLSGWEARDVPPDPVRPMPRPEGVVRVEVPFEAEEVVNVAYLTVPRQHPQRDALVVCDMLLSNSRTGLIDINLNQAQKVRSAGCTPRFMTEAGYQLLWAYPKPGQSLDEAEALLLEQVALLCEGKFTDEDLAAVVTDFEISEKRQLESNRSRVAMMTEAFRGRAARRTSNG